jgi:hypothetical protein
MGGLTDAIKYLYEKFILRDILSFIMPGAMVVFSASILFLPWTGLQAQFSNLLQFTSSIPWLLYIPLFGLFYMVGFSLQCFGEIIGLVRIHRSAKGSCHQRRKIFCDWDRESNIWWRKTYEEVVSFYKATQKKDEQGKDQYEWARLQHERLVVLKQMCANGFLASVTAAIFLITRYITNTVINRGMMPAENATYVVYGIVFIIGVMLTASLLWGYHIHELRLDTMEKEIKRQVSKGN